MGWMDIKWESDVSYFIEAVGSGRVKIGRSSCLRERIQSMQTGCPFPLRPILTLPLGAFPEPELHGRFQEWRVPGTREWFYSSDGFEWEMSRLVDGDFYFTRKSFVDWLLHSWIGSFFRMKRQWPESAAVIDEKPQAQSISVECPLCRNRHIHCIDDGFHHSKAPLLAECLHTMASEAIADSRYAVLPMWHLIRGEGFYISREDAMKSNPWDNI